MGDERGARYRLLKWTVLAVAVALVVLCHRFVFGRPSFDAEKVAQAETRMWRAYYSGNKMQLGLQLVSLLRNQHGLSLPEAKRIGELFAKSAIGFRSANDDYESIALPDLAKAYGLIKRATGSSFDPDKVAKAELAWWVARRTQGQDSAEQVGKRIAELYTLLYGRDCPALRKAGLLRAQAAALRDSGHENTDWLRVENLLRDSYNELKSGMQRIGNRRLRLSNPRDTRSTFRLSGRPSAPSVSAFRP
jgi:hypothetical protein